MGGLNAPARRLTGPWIFMSSRGQGRCWIAEGHVPTHRVVVAPPLAASSAVRVAQPRSLPHKPFLRNRLEAMAASPQAARFSPCANRSTLSVRQQIDAEVQNISSKAAEPSARAKAQLVLRPPRPCCRVLDLTVLRGHISGDCDAERPDRAARASRSIAKMVDAKKHIASTPMHVHCSFAFRVLNIASASLDFENAQNMTDDNAYLLPCRHSTTEVPDYP